MTTYTFDENIVSDLHKDARGYRPTTIWWEIWDSYSNDEKQTEWDLLCNELKETMAEDNRRETEMLLAFNRRVEDAIALGAATQKDAIRWIIESEGYDEFDLQYGADYVAYDLGLSYSNPHKATIEDVIKGMLSSTK